MFSRYATLRVARISFLVACGVFGYLGFRSEGASIAEALTHVHVVGIAAAYVLTVVGLYAAVSLWRGVAREFGLQIPPVQAISIYFVSQLGKYIPGSVWSIGAQAALASAYQAKPRVTSASGLVALGYFVTTGAACSALLGSLGQVRLPWPPYASMILLAGCVVALTPRVVNTAGSTVAGKELRLSWRQCVLNVGLCVVLWTAWTLGVLAPFGDLRHILAIAAAFGISYALGVLIVLAPAGLGPREALFITLLAPVTSLPHAAALAVVSRLVHALADVSVALLTWVWARRFDSPSRATHS